MNKINVTTFLVFFFSYLLVSHFLNSIVQKNTTHVDNELEEIKYYLMEEHVNNPLDRMVVESCKEVEAYVCKLIRKQ